MSSSSSDAAPVIANTQQPGLEWWRSTADDDAAALDYKRQLNREQKEKKKQEKKFAKQFGWWKGEAPYKADRPSNLRAYRASGGYRYKLESFYDFLQAHTAPSRSPKDNSDQSKTSRPASSASHDAPTFAVKPQFAPPSRYDQDKSATPPVLPDDHDGEDAYARRAQLSEPSEATVPLPPLPPPDTQDVPPPPPRSTPYAAVPPPPPPPEAQDATPPPPPSSSSYNPTISAPPVRYNPTISAPPVRYDNATISAPPVRYDVNDKQMNNDAEKPPHDERPAKRQKVSKAEAMMAKMGYVKGQGLGKNSDGITTHLEVKARKNEKRRVDPSDDFDDNGKNIKAQQVFDILGGHSTKRKEPERFGEESKVVVAWGCVDGIDWADDADRDDGGIRQEMGQTFDNKAS